MMTQAGRNGRKEVVIRCHDFVGVIELNSGGVPVVFRRRCRNRECCPPREGQIALHRWTIYGVQNGREIGEYTREYVPLRSGGELVEFLDRATLVHGAKERSASSE